MASVGHLSEETYNTILQSSIFQGQNATLMRHLLADAREWHCKTGQFIAQGHTPQEMLFLLLKGELETIPVDGTSFFEATPLTPGTLVGTPSAWDGLLWSDSIRCRSAVHVVSITLSSLRVAARDYPEQLGRIAEFRALIADQTRLNGALQNNGTALHLDQDAIRDLITIMTLRSYTGGSTIFHYGDQGDSLLIVVSGRLRASRMGEDGQRILFNDYGPGSSVGELSVILEVTRQADITAVRDSTVAVLNRKLFARILTKHPVAINQAFSRVIFDHLKITDEPKRRYSRVITLVPLQSVNQSQDVVRNLAKALEFHGSVKYLTQAQGEALLPEKGGNTHFIEELAELEQAYDYVILEGSHKYSPWTRQCIRQSDHLLFIAHALADPAPTTLEQKLIQEPWYDLLHKSLILIHDQDSTFPENSAHWLAARSVERHYHMRQGDHQDFQRLARFLIGKAIGLVLGGGGARGLAHLGLLRAMSELDIPIDMIGGNSIGALIGASHLTGFTGDEVLENIIRFSTSGQRPGLPILSLISGVPMARATRKFFGQRHIEDLWIPYFSVSCNLSRADLKTHGSGLLWQAVLASNSPAGLLPPVPDQGDLLVDAAVLNNVPVDVMRQRLGEGQIIAIDVNIRDELTVDPTATQLSGWQVLNERFNPLNKASSRTPGIMDIITRTSIIGAVAQQTKTRQLADLYLQPPVSEYPLFGFRHGADIVAAGYRYGLKKLSAWWQEQNSTSL
ncbi:MAG: cyclic nucleotide-binding domain-containing protein [Magnetococcales bacterium]|nr:cyclic nucleotide-binding domain-containing protein [Magnetococcales bacterium]